MLTYSQISPRTILFALTIFFFALFADNSARADSPAKPPLDVVLVMDSSGSMKWTDPRELRKAAAKLLISLLGANDRASVVSFSDQGYPVAFLTPVKGKENESKLFAAVDKISHKGVYTNLLGGVEGAMRVINRTPSPGRKTIVVLMTDGKMDLGDAAKNQANSETLLKEMIPKLRQRQIEVHTVAFTNESDKAYLEQVAGATGGKFNLAQTDKQLHDVYTAIFEQNKQPDMLPFDGEKFTVDGSIKEVTIVGSKDSEEVRLSLLTPSGKSISAADKSPDIKWFTAQAFDLITIQNPQPGQWSLKSSSGKNKAYIITDLQFQLQLEPPEVAIGEGLMIRAWLEDKGLTIDKPGILSTLTMALRVRTPDGATHELDMQAQAKEDGSGALSGLYQNYIALPAAGDYHVEVVAQGGTFSRARTSNATVFDPNARAAATHSEIKPAATQAATPTPAPAEPNIPAEPQETAHPPAAPHEAPAPIAAETQHVELPPVETPPVPAEPADAKPAEHAAEPAQDHAAVKPAEPSDAANESPKEEPAKNEPNLVKALGIFALINGIFALLGGAGFFVYRMKKKKSAAASKEDQEEAETGGREEKKRAA